MNDLPEPTTRGGRSRSSRARKQRRLLFRLALLYCVGAVVTARHIGAEEKERTEAARDRTVVVATASDEKSPRPLENQ